MGAEEPFAADGVIARSPCDRGVMAAEAKRSFDVRPRVTDKVGAAFAATGMIAVSDPPRVGGHSGVGYTGKPTSGSRPS